MVHLLTYDLHQPGRNYAELFKGIESLGLTTKLLESVWLIQTTLSCQQVRDRLQQCVDANDEISVLALSGNWATYGVDKSKTDWLRARLAA